MKNNVTPGASEKVVAFIQLMQQHFPTTFPEKPAPKVALKIGIAEDLKVWAVSVGESRRTVKKALSAWCRGTRYKRAIAKAGSPRYDLQGNIVDKVAVRVTKKIAA